MRRGLIHPVLAALLAGPQDSRSFTTRPGLPRSRPNGIRKATVRPWNERANERRRRQIEHGILRPTGDA